MGPIWMGECIATFDPKGERAALRSSAPAGPVARVNRCYPLSVQSPTSERSALSRAEEIDHRLEQANLRYLRARTCSIADDPKTSQKRRHRSKSGGQVPGNGSVGPGGAGVVPGRAIGACAMNFTKGPRCGPGEGVGSCVRPSRRLQDPPGTSACCERGASTFQ